eukprot:TRINITY_DN1825_c0_g1_i1.p1 TRINITY_DN1825_c0_g1~~TRINITY_DN1825_c0_g1_i1.p1  ORF type:complete len:190 (+),score=36.91 TRINITY_DN1825_c0_g1_i1:59-571(+)
MAVPGGPGARPAHFSLESVTSNIPADEAGAYEIIREEDLENLMELQKTKMDFRFWKRKAEEYHFGEGELVTTTKMTFPRLEHYTKCHDVTRDWVRCKTINRFLTGTGICNPLKDQVSMCVNDTWVERYRFRSQMYKNVWNKQEILSSKTQTSAHYDRAFLGMMVDDHDAD